MERHASVSYDAPTQFRFSRMGPAGEDPLDGDDITAKLARAMVAGGGTGLEDSHVPAGYTYLGQFIAHDLTFDKTIVTLGANVSPAQLLQGRSPALDLDSLYGAGPALSPRFYEADGIHLRVGGTKPGVDGSEKDGFDLPRGAGSTDAERRTAVIADPRNDDNLAVAQTHSAFIRFHNRVVDTLPQSVPEGLRFHEARERVTKHYQWMIRHDYLPLICAKSVVDDVFFNGRKAFEADADPTTLATMPIEFSIGTFRLGHSMVRGMYTWNGHTNDVPLKDLFEYSARGGDLGGNDRLPTHMIADFRRLYDLRKAMPPPCIAPNMAKRIDTRLSRALRALPPGTFDARDAPHADLHRNLAFRNLTRAQMVGLASGPQMARYLSDCGVSFTELEPRDILDDGEGAWLTGSLKARGGPLVERTPLWFYILREAELNDGRLNGVGARIVAETFHRAMECSEASIVRDPGWCPNLVPEGTPFGMVDLLLCAFERNPRLLAPLGPHCSK